MESDRQMLEESYRLAKENNRMLHKMRRNAFIGGILKFIFYLLVLVVAPLWLYTTYLAPIVQEATKAINQVQGTNAKAQSQFSSIENILKQLPAQFQPKQ